jgi:hypothetical protein
MGKQVENKKGKINNQTTTAFDFILVIDLGLI